MDYSWTLGFQIPQSESSGLRRQIISIHGARVAGFACVGAYLQVPTFCKTTLPFVCIGCLRLLRLYDNLI
jgi:hypothetical protein